MMKGRWYWLFALSASLSVGCGDDYEARVGAIMLDYDENTLVSTIPNVVTAGDPFQVEFSTWGGDCDEPTYEKTEYLEGGVLITPYERHYLGACVSILIEYPHRVEVVFDEPGQYVIEIRGRPTTCHRVDELVSAEHIVTVEE